MKKFYTFIIAILFSFTYMLGSTAVEPISERAEIEYRAENVKKNLSTPIKTIKIEVPSTMQLYSGDKFGIGFRTLKKELYKDVKYEINDSILNIWIDNIRPEEIDLMNAEDLKIKVMLPNDVSIVTSSRLSVTHYCPKNKYVTDYENN